MQLIGYIIIFIIAGIILILLRHKINGFTQRNRPTFFGTGGFPLADEMRITDPVPKNEKIYTISDNEVGPHCCPSAYSTSSGCICPILR